MQEYAKNRDLGPSANNFFVQLWAENDTSAIHLGLVYSKLSLKFRIYRNIPNGGVQSCQVPQSVCAIS